MLYEVVCNLCKMPAREQRECILNLLDDQNPVYDYLMSIWLPLTKRCESDKCIEQPTLTREQEEMIKFITQLNSKGVEDPMLFL